MELEFERKQIPCMNTLLRQLQTQEQTQELRLSEGMPDIGRVLGGWGQVILRGKEWRGDSITVTGGVMAWVLYLPEEGEALQQLETWIPFQLKWKLEDGHREGDIWVQTLLRFLDARSTSARKIMVRCGVGAMMQALRQEQAELAVPGELPQDIQLRKNRYLLQIPRLYGEKSFPVEEELPLPASAKMPRQLLAYSLEPEISETKVMADKLVLRGRGLLHLLYLTEEGKVCSWDLEFPISQLAQLGEELSPEADGQVQMVVTSLELALSEGRLHLKGNLLAQYILDDRQVMELTEDAYSPARPVQAKMGRLELPCVLERRQITVPVRQTLRGDAVSLVDLAYLPEFPEVRKGESFRLELPGQFQVLYYDENGRLNTATARTEEQSTLEAGEDTILQADPLPGEPPTAVVKGDLELRGESRLLVNTLAREGLPMVTGLQVGEKTPKDPSRPSVILRRAGEGELWDIAKSSGSTVAAIRAANGLEHEPAAGQILLIPVCG